MAKVQIRQIQCVQTANGDASDSLSIVVAADTPATILFETGHVFTNGSVLGFNDQIFNFNRELRIHLIKIATSGNLNIGPEIISATAQPFDGFRISQLFPVGQGLLGLYNVEFGVRPPTSPPSHSAPSQNQLNGIIHAIEEALAETFTVLPIGDRGSVTPDTMQYDGNSSSIHFHFTIQYDQSALPGFLGQVVQGSLYKFTTFYEGDISLQDPYGSVQQTQYGFDSPNIPGRGVVRVGINLPTLAAAIAAILA